MLRKPIRIIIVDDHAMMRDGIRSILENQDGYVVIAEATDGREAIELACRLAPDVMLLDVAMSGLNGLEATRKILAGDPQIAVIGLSMHSDERYVLGMLDAGARGYLLKTCDSKELFEAIEAAMRGKVFVTHDLTHVLMDRRMGRGPESQGDGMSQQDPLTPREREVLQLIAEGFTNKEIATKLGNSTKTVESHRANLMRKLDLHCIAQLTKYAIREGLTGTE